MMFINGYAYIDKNKRGIFIDNIRKKFPGIYEEQEKGSDLITDIIEDTITEALNHIEFFILGIHIVGDKDNPYRWFSEEERYRPKKMPNLDDIAIIFDMDGNDPDMFLELLQGYAYYGKAEVVDDDNEMIGYRYRFKDGKLLTFDNSYTVFPDDPDEEYNDKMINGVLSYIQNKEKYKKMALKKLLFEGMNF